MAQPADKQPVPDATPAEMAKLRALQKRYRRNGGDHLNEQELARLKFLRWRMDQPGGPKPGN